ncbi:hypothetical protein [Agromyces sp. LHK192]|uniref:hypothetical protein n=1 Tax=Agromyces sp. LHK192 TaxID=2498704 RepID=UPI000FDC4445|nr:hypothetical protein [Agromyces sp. LHK192]
MSATGSGFEVGTAAAVAVAAVATAAAMASSSSTPRSAISVAADSGCSASAILRGRSAAVVSVVSDAATRGVCRFRAVDSAARARAAAVDAAPFSAVVLALPAARARDDAEDFEADREAGVRFDAPVERSVEAGVVSVEAGVVSVDAGGAASVSAAGDFATPVLEAAGFAVPVFAGDFAAPDFDAVVFAAPDFDAVDFAGPGFSDGAACSPSAGPTAWTDSAPGSAAAGRFAVAGRFAAAGRFAGAGRFAAELPDAAGVRLRVGFGASAAASASAARSAGPRAGARRAVDAARGLRLGADAPRESVVPRPVSPRVSSSFASREPEVTRQRYQRGPPQCSPDGVFHPRGGSKPVRSLSETSRSNDDRPQFPALVEVDRIGWPRHNGVSTSRLPGERRANDRQQAMSRGAIGPGNRTRPPKEMQCPPRS